VATEEQFAEFHVELDETGSVYEQLRIIAANLDSFIRLMQSALMPIQHCSFPRTNFFSFPFIFCISLLLVFLYIYIYTSLNPMPNAQVGVCVFDSTYYKITTTNYISKTSL
jgi:hypothetical protein